MAAAASTAATTTTSTLLTRDNNNKSTAAPCSLVMTAEAVTSNNNSNDDDDDMNILLRDVRAQVEQERAKRIKLEAQITAEQQRLRSTTCTASSVAGAGVAMTGTVTTCTTSNSPTRRHGRRRRRSSRSSSSTTTTSANNNNNRTPSSVSSLVSLQTQVEGYRQLVDALTNERPAIVAAMLRERKRLLLLQQQQQSHHPSHHRHHTTISSTAILPLHVIRLLEILPWYPICRQSSLQQQQPQNYVNVRDAVYEWQYFDPHEQSWKADLPSFPRFFHALPVTTNPHGDDDDNYEYDDDYDDDLMKSNNNNNNDDGDDDDREEGYSSSSNSTSTSGRSSDDTVVAGVEKSWNNEKVMKDDDDEQDFNDKDDDDYRTTTAAATKSYNINSNETTTKSSFDFASFLAGWLPSSTRMTTATTMGHLQKQQHQHYYHHHHHHKHQRQQQEERVLTNANLTKRFALMATEGYPLPNPKLSGTWKWIGRWVIEKPKPNQQQRHETDEDDDKHGVVQKCDTNNDDKPLKEDIPKRLSFRSILYFFEPDDDNSNNSNINSSSNTNSSSPPTTKSPTMTIRQQQAKNSKPEQELSETGDDDIDNTDPPICDKDGWTYAREASHFVLWNAKELCWGQETPPTTTSTHCCDCNLQQDVAAAANEQRMSTTAPPTATSSSTATIGTMPSGGHGSTTATSAIIKPSCPQCQPQHYHQGFQHNNNNNKPIMRRRKWTRQRVLTDYPLASKATQEFLRLAAHNASMALAAQELRDKLVETNTSYQRAKRQCETLQTTNRYRVQQYQQQWELHEERIKQLRFGKFKRKIEELSCHRDDILPIIANPHLFCHLQQALRQSGAVTNAMLQQGIHFYIQDHVRKVVVPPLQPPPQASGGRQ